MIDARVLRWRVLTILGGGALFAGHACGGSNEPEDGSAESAGRGGDGGGGGRSTVQPNGGGGAFSAGGIGGCIPSTACFSFVAVRSAISGWGGAGGAVNDGVSGRWSAVAGAADIAGAAGSEAVSSCPALDPNKLYDLPPYRFGRGTGTNLVSGDPVIDAGGAADTSVASECCYQVNYCVFGRPFTVAGTPRRASSRARGDWALVSGGSLDTIVLDAPTRAALARAWLADALAEHASIASFARLTLELMQHGAPAELVAESQRASLDEIEHARACFALAARYAGAQRGPDNFPLDAALGPVALAELASRTVHEGCVGETVAALIAAEQARSAVDPGVRAVLEKIAEDEARHAEFAWRVVKWALEVGGPATRTAVALAFEQQAPTLSHRTEAAQRPRGALAAHGQLTHAERAIVVARGVRDVVAPCARALLSANSVGARPMPSLSAQI